MWQGEEKSDGSGVGEGEERLCGCGITNKQHVTRGSVTKLLITDRHMTDSRHYVSTSVCVFVIEPSTHTHTHTRLQTFESLTKLSKVDEVSLSFDCKDWYQSTTSDGELDSSDDTELTVTSDTATYIYRQRNCTYHTVPRCAYYNEYSLVFAIKQNMV